MNSHTKTAKIAFIAKFGFRKEQDRDVKDKTRYKNIYSAKSYLQTKINLSQPPEQQQKYPTL